jgi:hypothetical protein
MKRTNILSLTGLAGLLVFILLTFFSCSDAISDSAVTESSKSPDGKTYIMLGESKISAERTIFPATGSSGDFAVSKLTNIILKGKLSDAAGAEKTLATAETYSLIDSKLIPIEAAGNWTFTLTANLRGAAFTGTTTKEIVLGSTNSISFSLSANENYGGMSIRMTFTGTSTNADDYKVVAKLMKADKSETLETKEFTSTDLTPSSNATSNKTFYVTYERSAAPAAGGVAETRLASGTYYLVFEIYSNTLGGTEPLNTSRNFVRIENGLTTTAALSITLNEVYTIEYNDNEGTDASGTRVFNYSPKTGAELPKMTPTDSTKFFAGWYTEDGKKVSVVEGDKLVLKNGTSGNLSLLARYCTPDLYVAPTFGIEGADGLSEDSAAKTLALALSLLKGYASPLDWTIHIIGTLEGAQEISSAITTSEAASLAITGGIGSDDSFNGNFGETAVENGTTLTIGTAVPVTITNLKITGGNTSGNGGGISIASGATVKLGDGAVVSGNSATNGGGVSIVSATMTMTGGEISGNTAQKGGGINVSGSSSVFTMTGGCIKTNTSTDSSGGRILYVATTGGNTATVAGESVTGGYDLDIDLNPPIGSKSAPDAVGDIVFTDGTAEPYTSLTESQKSKAIAVIFYVGTGEATIGTNENILGQKILGVGLKNTKGLAWAPGDSADPYNLDNSNNSYGYVATFDGCARENSAPTGSVYYTYTVDQGGTDRNYYLTGSSYFDGSNSWQKICNCEDEEERTDHETPATNYPAFNWVNSYASTNDITVVESKPWYLPSVVELRCLYDSKTPVSAALTAVGGDPLDATDYWSCSQDTNHASQAWAVRFSDGDVYSDCGKNYTGVEGHDTIGVCAIRQF